MTYLQSRINDFFRAEENRLARLKIFCAANNLIDYAASEKIAKACNDCAANGFYLSTDEAQHRFMIAYRYGVEDLDLAHLYFWDLFWFIVEKRR